MWAGFEIEEDEIFSAGRQSVKVKAGSLACFRAAMGPGLLLLILRDMPGGDHALVQNAHDAKAVFARPVNSEMGSDRVDQMRRGQVVSAKAQLWVVTERHERVVDLIAVDPELSAAPSFPGKAQYVDEIRPCSRRKLDWQRPKGGHQGPSLGHCALR